MKKIYINDKTQFRVNGEYINETEAAKIILNAGDIIEIEEPAVIVWYD